MDPLSITATCIALVSTITKTSVLLGGFVKDVRAARSDLDGVSRELLSLKTVLELLADGVADFTNESFLQALEKQITGIVTNCTGVVVEIAETLKKLEGNKLGKAAQWVAFGKNDVVKLRSSLEAHRSALEIALQIVTLTMAREIKADTQELLNDTSAIKGDTAQTLAEIARLQEQLPRDAQRDHASGFMLERYLEDLTSYAETIYDPFSDNIDERRGSGNGSIKQQRSTSPTTRPSSIAGEARITENNNAAQSMAPWLPEDREGKFEAPEEYLIPEQKAAGLARETTAQGILRRFSTRRRQQHANDHNGVDQSRSLGPPEIAAAAESHPKPNNDNAGAGIRPEDLESGFSTDTDLENEQAAVIDPPVDSGYEGSVGLVKEALGDQGDRMTVITDGQSVLDFPERENLVRLFVTGLRNGLGPQFGTTEATLNIEKPVFDLLKDFTLKLQQNSLEPMKRNAAIFVRQNRKRIAKSLHDNLESELAALHDAQNAERANQTIPWEPKVDSWIPDSNPYPVPEDSMSILENGMDEIDEAGESTVDLEEAIESQFDWLHTYLKESDAYQWLLTKIQALTLLTRENEGALANVRRIVGGAYDDLERPGVPVVVQTLEFQLSVDLTAFLSWYWENATCKDLCTALTLTGSPVDAQALTCEEYLNQTWPTYGAEILRLLEGALITYSDSGEVRRSKLSDGTNIEYQIFNNLVCFIATGTRPSLVEIGEQLTWLCSALRSSEDEDSISLSTAIVKSSGSTIQIDTQCEVVQNIGLDISQNGCCWHPLFQNPVIVQGFPTLARRHGERGLEVPVDIMAGLGNTDYHVVYKEVPVLKAFSSMFIATQQLACSMLWHFVVDPSGQRVPYSTVLDYHRDDSAIEDFGTTNVTRNFVGWTSSIRRLAGTRAVNYPGIDRSRLDDCTAGFVLERATLNGGKFVTPSITFGRGARNRVLKLLSDRSYPEAVRYATRTYVNFYDVGDRRGWLLDGARAVLHLTLAQMTHPMSPYSTGNHFDIKAFNFASPDNGAESATMALNDEFNKYVLIDQDPSEVTVHKTTKGEETTEEEERSVSKKYLFWEQVKLNLSNFELMTDYQKEQVDVIRGTTRERLEGWDFLELVEGEKSVKPKFTYIEPSGRGWVDLVREIYAINLLGTGFGALLQPVDGSAELCKNWKEVPKDRDYLTMGTSTLHEICKKFGNINEDPIRIARNIYLHQGGHLYEKCTCGTRTSACDRVQVVLPKLSTPKRNPKSLFSEANRNGAVIFGRSERFSWSFPPIGLPKMMRAGKESDTESTGPWKRFFKLRRSPPSDSGYGSGMSTTSPNSGLNSQTNASSHSNTSTPTDETNTLAGPSSQNIASTLRNTPIPANEITAPRITNVPIVASNSRLQNSSSQAIFTSGVPAPSKSILEIPSIRTGSSRRIISPPGNDIQAPEISNVSNLLSGTGLQGSSSQDILVPGTPTPSGSMPDGLKSERGFWSSMKRFSTKAERRLSKG